MQSIQSVNFGLPWEDQTWSFPPTLTCYLNAHFLSTIYLNQNLQHTDSGPQRSPSFQLLPRPSACGGQLSSTNYCCRCHRCWRRPCCCHIEPNKITSKDLIVNGCHSTLAKQTSKVPQEDVDLMSVSIFVRFFIALFQLDVGVFADWFRVPALTTRKFWLQNQACWGSCGMYGCICVGDMPQVCFHFVSSVQKNESLCHMQFAKDEERLRRECTSYCK